MRICVFGLWHLGTVTAGCLASAGFRVTGIDPDGQTVALLKEGRPPLFEPGLEDLIRKGISGGRLDFTTDLSAAKEADLIWVAFDTPVRDDDSADVESVTSKVESLFPHLRDGAMVLISSQLPVGTTAALEHSCRNGSPQGSVRFAYSPENLRLGNAIAAFCAPERIVAGVRSEEDRRILASLFKPFSPRIEWMSVESAEMTKHALNSFLAAEVTLTNEIASICEYTGADASEVERGLRTDPRVGPKAYVKAGGPFAGGTLARDVTFLKDLALAHGTHADLLGAVLKSNETHAGWPRRRLAERIPDLSGKRIALWGLAYKPDTDTLRRSRAVELAEWLSAQGAAVAAFDPRVRELPVALAGRILLTRSAEEALDGAHALVVATAHPEFRRIPADEICRRMENRLVLDADGFLKSSLEGVAGLRYFTVGSPA